MKSVRVFLAVPFYVVAGMIMTIGTIFLGVAVLISGNEWPEEYPAKMP